MSHISRRLVTLAGFSLALLPALVRAEDAPITLNLVPLPNTHQQHDFRIQAITDMKFKAREGASEEEVQQWSAKMGAVKMPLHMTLQMRQSLQTGKADATGRIPMTARIEHNTMDMRNGDGDLMPGMPRRGMPATQFSADIVGGRYQNIRLSGEGAAQLPPQLMEGAFRKAFDALAVMNGASLRVGESLEVPLEMNLPLPELPGGSNAGKVAARYTLTQVKDGVAFFDVDASLDVKLDLPVPATATAAGAASAPEGEASPAATSMQLLMAGKGSGHMQVQLADRLQRHNDFDMQIALDVPLPQGHAMQMKVQMQMVSDGRMLPPLKTRPVSAPAKAAAGKAAATAGKPGARP